MKKEVKGKVIIKQPSSSNTVISKIVIKECWQNYYSAQIGSQTVGDGMGLVSLSNNVKFVHSKRSTSPLQVVSPH